MGLLNLTESERREILNLHNNAKIIKEQTAPATTTAPATAPVTTPQTAADVIKELQTLLNTKYGAKLTVDGKWGNLTQTAFETAVKSKSATPAGTGTQLPTVTVAGQKAPDPAIAAAPKAPLSVMPPTVPGVSYQTKPVEPTSQTSSEVLGTEVGQTQQPELSAQSQQALSGQLTPQQIRQQGRFDQRLARQARRNERRAGQQGQQQ